MVRRKTYVHERADWPRLWWDSAAIAGPLAAVRHRQGRLLGRMEGVGLRLRDETTLRALTREAVGSSGIEGEAIEAAQVRSSLARRLGMETGGVPVGRGAEAIATVVLDATQRFGAALTEERLFGWHAALFAQGAGGRQPITVGAWRDDALGAMQVVSGWPGRERVHFVAPAAGRVAGEMAAFLAWFEGGAEVDPVLRAAVAHLWFVTVHPFDDGNGRIGRAIAGLTLARSEGTGRRFYSLSERLLRERGAYYAALEAAQGGGVDVTAWVAWFLGVFDRALGDAEAVLEATLRRARVWEGLAGEAVNARQRGMLERLLDGFEGRLTTSKWARIAGCSQDTALRDIEGLVRLGVLVKEAGGGRSTGYGLAG
jgi:Fic family protein